MADPICRWRNATPNTLQLLVSLLPKQRMSEADFKNATEANCKRIGFKYDVFTGTAYQLATQLGLYYIDESQTYFPRFNHDISIEEAKAYLIKAARSYVSPNPYTPSMNKAARAICIYDYLVQYAKSKGQGYAIDVKSVLQDAYGIGLGNMDIVVNLMVQTGDFEKADAQHIIFKEESAMTKGEFFGTFDAWKGKNALKSQLGNLQIITYGAPGTGKSRQTKDETAAWEEKGNVFRTTFHPDSDYSTFVGAYKPVMGDDAGLTEVWKQTKDGEVQEAVHRKKKGITYRFVAQEFIKAYVRAWVKMAEATKDADGKLNPEPVYLVIEEINRGNCAQIFGDLFQLLDRENDTGYSEYSIDADEELSKYLASVFAALVKDDEGKAKIPAKVLSGEQMMLPPNMLLRATMNTSDQSLFPIDSAFKRRWDWEYVPILEGKDKNTKTPLGWKIVVGADAARKEYDWWSFVGKINDVIDELTSSEDKKLGYFFVKPKDKTIDQKLLVNKVFFYLWNDVFRDMVGDPALQVQINGKGHDLKFHDFFKKDDGAINVDMIKAFMDKLKVESPAGNQQGGTTSGTAETTVTE